MCSIPIHSVSLCFKSPLIFRDCARHTGTIPQQRISQENRSKDSDSLVWWGEALVSPSTLCTWHTLTVQMQKQFKAAILNRSLLTIVMLYLHINSMTINTRGRAQSMWAIKEEFLLNDHSVAIGEPVAWGTDIWDNGSSATRHHIFSSPSISTMSDCGCVVFKFILGE